MGEGKTRSKQKEMMDWAGMEKLGESRKANKVFFIIKKAVIGLQLQHERAKMQQYTMRAQRKQVCTCTGICEQNIMCTLLLSLAEGKGGSQAVITNPLPWPPRGGGADFGLLPGTFLRKQAIFGSRRSKASGSVLGHF